MSASVARAAVALCAACSLAAPAVAFDIVGSRTEAEGQTSAAGARFVQLRFSAELVNEGGPNFTEDVFVGWQEVGGVEPVPFRVLIPAGCFKPTRRGFRLDDFATCGVQLTVGTSDRGLVLLDILDCDARVARRDDGTTRFDLVASFIPPDPVIPPDPIVPPDPIRAFLGLIGGAAVRMAVGSEVAASPPLRAATLSGIEPTPF